MYIFKCLGICVCILIVIIVKDVFDELSSIPEENCLYFILNEQINLVFELCLSSSFSKTVTIMPQAFCVVPLLNFTLVNGLHQINGRILLIYFIYIYVCVYAPTIFLSAKIHSS